MYRPLGKKFFLILIIFLMMISGCSSIMDNLPVPPDMFVKLELNGPYDKEIPQEFIKQLKNTSLVSDWAIPYIFVSIGMHFDSSCDELRAIHFFDRAITEFRRRRDSTGEGTALNHKIVTLCKFGKIKDAFDAISDAEKNRPDAFVYHSYGHYYLMNGNYNKSLDYFRKSLQANEDFHNDFNLMILRRNSELECGMALILADCFPAMSPKIKLLDFDEAFSKEIRKNADESIVHLNQVVILNNEIRQTKIAKFIPENVFQVMESDAYNFLGLSSGIKGNIPESLNYLETARKLSVKANYLIGEIESIFFRNQLYLLGKNIPEGQKAARELNEIADKYQLPFYQIWAKFILFRYCLGDGDSSQAIRLLKDAIAVIESRRSELVIDTLKDTYMLNSQLLYDALIEILAAEGDYKGALAIAERANQEYS